MSQDQNSPEQPPTSTGREITSVEGMLDYARFPRSTGVYERALDRVRAEVDRMLAPTDRYPSVCAFAYDALDSALATFALAMIDMNDTERMFFPYYLAGRLGVSPAEEKTDDASR